MSASLREIRLLEQISGRAWPPRLQIAGDGWEARYADGMFRRVNSATVWPEAGGDLPSLIRHIEVWYRDHGVRPAFKVTRASAPGLDEVLAEQGYAMEAPTRVRTRRPPPAGAPAAIDVTSEPTPEWLAALTTSLGYGRRERALVEAQLSRIASGTGYGLVRRDETAAAVGLAVAEKDHVGIFEVATLPGYRGHGLAATVVTGLLAWGFRRGAGSAYLQVTEDNLAATRLYRHMGFAGGYRYWYRIAGDPAAPSGPLPEGMT